MSSSKSFIYIKNSIGPNTDPCGTPHKTDFQFEISPSTIKDYCQQSNSATVHKQRLLSAVQECNSSQTKTTVSSPRLQQFTNKDYCQQPKSATVHKQRLLSAAQECNSSQTKTTVSSPRVLQFTKEDKHRLLSWVQERRLLSVAQECYSS